MRILVAMSGGIDSSVCAHLLRQQGHEVIGVRFTLWMDPKAPVIAQLLPSKCCTVQSIHRADAVAKKIGIPLHVIDLEKEFKRTVINRFLQEYAAGLTPNPCVLCNRTIKHAALMKLVKKYKCDKVATGHYARIKCSKNKSGVTICRLLEARDKKKDQSYYLSSLSQEQLQATIFPLGNILKSEVYTLAKKFKIPLSDSYRESQDLCFFPEKEPKEFLKRHLKLKPGDIVRRDGTVMGRHAGLPLYTVGQRRGLKIGGLKIPLEVVRKDTKSNRLIVAEKGLETCREIHLTDLHFIAVLPPKNGKYFCRTRSLSAKKRGCFQMQTNNQKLKTKNSLANVATFTFLEPSPLPSPGQSLVLYKGDEIIGSGTIFCSSD